MTALREVVKITYVIPILCLFGNTASIGANLPPCSGDYWDKCFGSITYENGDTYIGEWRNNKENGQGTWTTLDGHKYSGGFKNGLQEGKGKYIFPNGEQYIGEYRNGKRNGKGTVTNPNGMRYIGEWKDGQKNGQGEYRFGDGPYKGAVYTGEFINDYFEGEGTYIFQNGEKYTGTFKNNIIHGQGTYTWPSGEKYIGEYVNGVEEGQGTFIRANGETYIGEFKNRKKNGQGTYIWTNGGKYVGEFKDDAANGFGTYYFGNGPWKGDVYSGEFKNHEFSGQGTYTHKNGEKYIGEFKNNQPNGSGTAFYSDGTTKQVGIWANGKFVKEAKIEQTPATAEDKNSPTSNSQAKSKIEDSESSGTAFRIADDKFITNNHVIDGCKRLKIGGSDDTKVLGIDTTNDLALIEVKNLKGNSASIRTSRIQLNETITTAGFPLQGLFSDIAITNGTITRLSGLKGDTSRIQISAPVQPGNSGGPLLDSAGNIIGVVTAKLNALKVAEYTGDVTQNVNFAISSNTLRAFLDSKGINYKEISKEPDLRGEEIAKKAAEFTVLVECN